MVGGKSLYTGLKIVQNSKCSPKNVFFFQSPFCCFFFARRRRYKVGQMGREDRMCFLLPIRVSQVETTYLESKVFQKYLPYEGSLPNISKFCQLQIQHNQVKVTT